MATLIAAEYKQFEDIKHTDENGVEFWYARELSLVLDYTQWHNFSKVIDKAMLSCQNSGIECADHVVEVSKIVDAGYMGSYGGLTAADIHRRKKLKKSEKILDHMGSEELGANLFRITQTEANPLFMRACGIVVGVPKVI